MKKPKPYTDELMKQLERCHSEPNSTTPTFILMRGEDRGWSIIDTETREAGFGDTPIEAINNFNEPWPEDEPEITNLGKMLHMDRWKVVGDDGQGRGLAEAHADWLFDLLRKIYVEAFEHGYKHGREDK